MDELPIILLPAIITGLVQVSKQTELIPDKFLPLFSVLIGIVLGMTSYANLAGLIYGIICGLAGSGFYDLVKFPIKAIIEKTTPRS